MESETKFIIGMILLWIICAIVSISITCGIIWFALWSAKQFGLF